MKLTQDTPRVHVLLASYNGAEHLRSQVSSILAQKGVAVTLTIRVDPSTDGTAQLAQGLRDDDAKVQVRLNEEPSGGAAANFLQLLTEDIHPACDFVAFADQDDLWFEDKLGRAVSALASQQADGYSSDVFAWWPGRNVRRVRKSHRQRAWDHRFSAPGPGCTFVMSAELARGISEAVRAHRESAAAAPLHDWLVYAWAREHGFTWYIDDHPGMLYRQHDTNVIGANVGVAAARSRLSSSSRRWYADAVSAVARFLDESRDPHTAPRGAPITKRQQMARWRELRRPLAEAVVCAGMLLFTPGQRREMRDG